MNKIMRTSFFVLVGLLLLSLTGCVGLSATVEEGLVLGQSYRLESGETIDHDLTVIGGSVVIEDDATVNGDLAVMGGNVTVDGTIDGNVSVIGGTLSLEDNAVVRGDVTGLGGTIHKAKEAVIEGREMRANRPWNVTTMRTPPVNVVLDPIGGFLGAIFQALALGALAVLVNLFAARLMDRTGRSAVAQPIASGGVGLLTVVVAPALLILMAITIILLPISLLGFAAVGIAALFGWISLALMVGWQLAQWLKQPWSEPVIAGVGAVVLSLVGSLLNVMPCIGWTVNFLIWMIALGATVLTRFGTQIYPAPYDPIRPMVPPTYEAGDSGARVYDAPREDR